MGGRCGSVRDTVGLPVSRSRHCRLAPGGALRAGFATWKTPRDSCDTFAFELFADIGDGVPGDNEELEVLRREVVALRSRVAELQRAAARHEDAAGASLAAREELLRDAERVAHVGTWTWEPASGRVTWSDEMYRILGHDLGQLTPSVEAFFAAVHPEDRERATAASEQSLRDGVLPLLDCRIVRPDGTVRHTTHTSSMLFDAAGTPQRIVGSVLDRTESLGVEAKLRQTLTLLEEAQRFAQLGSWRLDTKTGSSSGRRSSAASRVCRWTSSRGQSSSSNGSSPKIRSAFSAATNKRCKGRRASE
jgi:PAS domain-containing protein